MTRSLLKQTAEPTSWTGVNHFMAANGLALGVDGGVGFMGRGQRGRTPAAKRGDGHGVGCVVSMGTRGKPAAKRGGGASGRLRSWLRPSQ